MDIVKTATDWARAEVLSSSFFILAGGLYLIASVGFWQLGRTEIARAYTIPTLVAGGLLLIIGVGILLPSLSRLSSFPADYANDASAFVTAELTRADKVLNEYRIAVFRVIPAIIIFCAVLVVFLDGPLWRTSLITTISLMTVVMLIDTNANARLEDYSEKLRTAAQQQGG